MRARIVVVTWNMKISRRHLTDCVMKIFQKACCTFIFPHWTDQIIEISSAVSSVFAKSLNEAKFGLTCVSFWQNWNLPKGRVTRVGAASVAASALLETSLRFFVKHSYTKHIFDAKDLFRALNGRPRCQIKFEKYFPFGMFTGNLYKFQASQS